MKRHNEAVYYLIITPFMYANLKLCDLYIQTLAATVFEKSKK
jgi:hypothetical protein